MTLDNDVNAYDCDDNGVITSPGKFEGEQNYVPYFWNLGLDGCADTDISPDSFTDDETHSNYLTDHPVFGFGLTDADRAKWPELKGQDRIELWESDLGFVFHDVLPRDYSTNEAK